MVASSSTLGTGCVLSFHLGFVPNLVVGQTHILTLLGLLGLVPAGLGSPKCIESVGKLCLT